MAEYVSGEQYREMAGSHHRKPTQLSSSKLLPAIIGVVVLMGLSFYGGVAYQKSRHSSTTTTLSSGSGGGFAGGGRRFGGQRPTVGQVTAISSSSITVQDSRSGTSLTFSITSSTQITDNGQTVTTSDIQSGDTVFVIADTSNPSQASRILVNPSFGGAGGASNNSSSSTTN